MTSAYEQYGKLAELNPPPLVQAARYAVQADAERLVVADIESKLALEPTHSLLEIGCGPGNLLIPLSFRVRRAVGVDHPNVITRARQRYSCENLQWVAGRFPDIALDGPFDRILIYAVIHYLEDFFAVSSFVGAAAALMSSNGRLLLGDIPNADRKRRFQSSEAGKQFEAEWQQRMKEAHAAGGSDGDFALVGHSKLIGTLNDPQVLELASRLRVDGFHSYVLPQPPSLPFGHTREDILVVRP